VKKLRLIAWSDYLCPWCYNGSVRLAAVQQKFANQVELEFRSFLLRPKPNPNRDLEKFRRYTQSWMRPAADQPAGRFRVWEGDASPPSHSIPPHLIAKAAAQLGPDAFERMHERLLRAYFNESRDVTDDATLLELWQEAGLERSEFDRREDPALLELVLSEHNAAIEAGANGVPTVMIENQNVPITGAHPIEMYERWISRQLASD
jgi:predicted DsbA family dithiol-disulfide isomerase